MPSPWPELCLDKNSAQAQRLERVGFRLGDKGTHTSRTMMLEELRVLLREIPPEAPRTAYVEAAVAQNVLRKRTEATRKLTVQRLSELYALDPSVPVFRFLRRCWRDSETQNSVLALLVALARDPLLRATAEPVLGLRAGEELRRQEVAQSLQEVASGRLNPSTVDKVVRNAASSWTQSGHLRGRGHKLRQTVTPGPGAVGLALFLGYAEGERGEGLLGTHWMRALDLTRDASLAFCGDAKRLGLVDLNYGGGVVDISFAAYLTQQEKELFLGTR